MAGQVLGDDAGVSEITAAPQATLPKIPSGPVADAQVADILDEPHAVDILDEPHAVGVVVATPGVLDEPQIVSPVEATPDEETTQAPGSTSQETRGLGFWALVRRHPTFAVLLTIGTLLRIITMIGYQPAMWFNDSFDYLHAALRFYPHPIRPDGYSFFLLALYPLHSFALVVGLQHLMGAGIGLMIYALLRTRFRLPGWGASLAAAPVLLDAYQIQLEQLILSDVMFEFLVAAAITALLWRARPSWKMGAAVGLLLGLAGLTRSLGPAVLAATVVYLLARRTNWRVLVAVITLWALPTGAYMAWYASVHGKFSTTGTSGIFLYARVSAFADCNKIKNLPVEEIPLCYVQPPRFSQDAIWDSKNSRLLKNSPNKFSDYQNQLASDFSKRAIMAQPGDYLRVMSEDFFRTFRWNRTVFPDRATYNLYQFGKKPRPLPNWAMPGGGTASGEAHQYERGNAATKVIEPFGGIMRFYQKYFFVHGTIIGVLLLAGLVGMVPFWRRLGGRALLPWITSVGLLLAPAATAEFDYRYVLPAVPLACLAAALAFTPESRNALRIRRKATNPD